MTPDGGSPVWTAGWIAWMGFFLLWEGMALFSKRDGRTLSEHVWWWAAVKDARPTKVTWAIRMFVLVGWLWLGPHLLLGWFTPTDPTPW